MSHIHDSLRHLKGNTSIHVQQVRQGTIFSMGTKTRSNINIANEMLIYKQITKDTSVNSQLSWIYQV